MGCCFSPAALRRFENDVILTWDMIWPRLAMIWTAVALFYVWFLIMFRYDRYAWSKISGTV
jgi:hypothetical protein